MSHSDLLNLFGVRLLKQSSTSIIEIPANSTRDSLQVVDWEES